MLDYESALIEHAGVVPGHKSNGYRRYEHGAKDQTKETA
jgi:hypothetical protein